MILRRFDLCQAIKGLIKSLIAGLLFYNGFFRLLRFFYNLKGRRVIILTYHRVGKEEVENLHHYCLPSLLTKKSSFEKQLQFLTKYYHIISLEDLIFTKNIPKNSLVITFDDGYEDNYLYAYPVLKRYGIPGTIFLTSSHVGTNKTFWWDRMWFIGNYLASYPNRIDFSNGIYSQQLRNYLSKIRKKSSSSNVSHILSNLIRIMEGYPTPRIEAILADLQDQMKINWSEFGLYNRMLTLDQIKEMKENGIDLGSHTRSHPNLSLILKNDLEKEIQHSKEDIEKWIGEKIFAFSYPGGRSTETAREVVQESGYQCACSSRLGVNVLPIIDPLALRRISVWEGKVRGFRDRYSDAMFAFNLIRHYGR